jgi:hypothetical protein
MYLSLNFIDPLNFVLTKEVRCERGKSQFTSSMGTRANH